MKSTSIAATAGWGLFCACSWTWVIGMYLPVIMLERYGGAGFWAFFFPNVMGCAAFGYMVKTRTASQRMVEMRGRWMQWFSVATIGFHFLFAALLTMTVLGPDSGSPNAAPFAFQFDNEAVAAISVIGLLWIAGTLVSRLGDTAWLWFSAAAWIGSIAIFWVLVDRLPVSPIGSSSQSSSTELLWLTPIIVFGFLLCPYFDLTFHRALQRSPSRHSFGVFGVTFAAILFGTIIVWYAFASDRSDLARTLLLSHLAIQSVFTVGAHLRELREHMAEVAKTTIAPLAIGAATIAYLLIAQPLRGDDTYLRYLVLYGLVFPLAVWMFIGPGRRWPQKPNAILLYAVILLVMFPVYELGFIQRRATWFVMAFGVFIFVKLIAYVVGSNKAACVE